MNREKSFSKSRDLPPTQFSVENYINLSIIYRVRIQTDTNSKQIHTVIFNDSYLSMAHKLWVIMTHDLYKPWLTYIQLGSLLLTQVGFIFYYGNEEIAAIRIAEKTENKMSIACLVGVIVTASGVLICFSHF